MRKVRKICCQITPRRVMGAILIAASVVNLLIVGAVYKTAVPDAAPRSSVRPTSSGFLTLGSTSEIPTAIPSTPTNLPTQTFTASPTSTFTFTPTETPTATASNTPLPSPTQCVPQYFWPIYVVQPRDNLSAIALITGSSVPELMLANCLTRTLIYVGQRLYVPYLPIPTATITSTYTPIVPTNGPTVFQEVSVCYGITSTITDYSIFIQVIPFDLEGINSLVVFFRVNGGSWNRLRMTPSGDFYTASGPLDSKPTANDKVYYIFQATDNVGNIGISAQLSNYFEPCPVIN